MKDKCPDKTDETNKTESGEVDQFVFLFKDSKKRIVLKAIDNQIMVARFKDMEKTTKDKIIMICKEISDFDIKKLRKFLNYKITEDEFCS